MRSLFFLLLFAAAAVEVICEEASADNFHCITIPSRPGACYYFVHNVEHNHDDSFAYCATTFNGRLATIEDTTMMVHLAKAYNWWAGYMPNQLFRSGHYIRDKIASPADCHVHNTRYSFQGHNIDVDDSTWMRVFCSSERVRQLDEVKSGKLCTDVEDVRSIQLDAAENWNRIRGSNRQNYVAIEMDTAKAVTVNWDDKIPFICEAPRYPKSFCEPGWKLHMRSRSCFKLFTDATNHAVAMQNCRDEGAALASINDLSEWNLVRGLHSGGNNVYFGLRYTLGGVFHKDVSVRRRRFWERAFNVDGSKFDVASMDNSAGDKSKYSYPPWQKNQPQAVREKCLLFESSMQWHDYDADSKKRFYRVCRKMAEQVPPLK